MYDAQHEALPLRPAERRETEDPLAILKVRLAKGEITEDDYRRLASVVGAHASAGMD